MSADQGRNILWAEGPTKELSYLPDEEVQASAAGPANLGGLRRLSKFLIACAKGGRSACEIGQCLHKIVYECDPSLRGGVSKMIAARKTYAEIAFYVFRALDLRDDGGRALYQRLPQGDPYLRPGTNGEISTVEKIGPGRSESPLTCENPNTYGPELICPKPRRIAKISVLDESEELEAMLERGCNLSDNDEEDEEFETNVAQLMSISVHRARKVRVRKP